MNEMSRRGDNMLSNAKRKPDYIRKKGNENGSNRGSMIKRRGGNRGSAIKKRGGNRGSVIKKRGGNRGSVIKKRGNVSEMRDSVNLRCRHNSQILHRLDDHTMIHVPDIHLIQ
jgi:hypothetical protein